VHVPADEAAAPTATPDVDATAAEIRSDIEQTRAEMSETIDALQEKLDPARIAQQVKEEIRDRAGEAYESAKESVKETVRDATIGRVERIVANVKDQFSGSPYRAGDDYRETRSSLMQTVRDNPFATALIGVGVGMLWMKRRSQSYGSRYDMDRGSYGGDRYVVGQEDFYSSRRAGDRYYAGRGYYAGAGERESSGLADKASDVADAAREKVSDVADAARDAAHRATDAVSSAASRVADTTREQAQYVAREARYRANEAGDMFERALEERPMAVGIAALALGALVGMALPETRVENRYMGETRDNLVENAKSVAQDTVQKAQRVAHEATQHLNDDAGQRAGEPSRTGTTVL